jgi:hypothetical protein
LGDGVATTDLGGEIAVAERALFVARTRTRNAFPTSTDVTVNVLLVAPMMLAQFAPLVSHRRHW